MMIVLQTFKSLLREKIVFNVFGITLLLLFFGYLASLLVYGHQDRVMLDLGVMMNAFSIFSVAISIGNRQLRQEIESKAIYLPLTRGISRTRFFFSRVLGMGLFSFFNFLILTAVLWGAVKVVNGQVSEAFFQAAILTYLEALILMAASLMLSFWWRSALVFMAMFTFVFLGHNHELIGSLQSSLGFLKDLTPNLSLLVMSDRVYYDQAFSSHEFLSAGFYGLFWLFFFLLIGNAVFSRKNL